MMAQSTIIRKWLGEPPNLFVTSNSKILQGPNSAVREFVDYVALKNDSRGIVSVQELRARTQHGERFNGTLTVMYLNRIDDDDLLRKLVDEDLVARLFVIVWSPLDMIRLWLDGKQACDLGIGSAHDAPDAVQL